MCRYEGSVYMKLICSPAPREANIAFNPRNGTALEAMCTLTSSSTREEAWWSKPMLGSKASRHC